MRTVICFWTALIFAMGAVAQNGSNSKSDDEQALRRIELQMARAEQENDWSKIGAIIADDWVGLGQKSVTKAEVELGIKHAAQEHGSQPYTVEKKNMRVDLFGDTGVVTYMKDYRQTADSSKVAHEDDTDVFTRTPQGWRLRFTKMSPVQTPVRNSD